MMSIDFNADEVFEIAEQIERNGAEFYRMIAGEVTGERKKNLLLNLARMEDEHEKIFKKLRAQLSSDEQVQTTFDPNGESESYLHALANTRIFYEKKVDTSSYEEILKSAITAEKDSIVFYLGMREVVPTEEGKCRMDDIIKEEMSHIKLLSNELIEFKNSC
jgi:rubrerythrin